jgi:dCMP deaminase
MFEKWRQRPEVYIPGGFDMLHLDHKEFILRCIQSAEGISRIDRVVFGLMSDEQLHTRGPIRPFFTYDWRAQDLLSFAKSQGLAAKVEAYDSPLSKKNRQRVVAYSNEYAQRQYTKDTQKIHGRLVFAPPLNQTHTSDIAQTLHLARESSACMIKVGAVLLGEGVVKSIGFNGGPDEESCRDCGKCKELRRQLEAYGEQRTALPPCDYPHAEAACLKTAEKGDWLLTTTAPCRDCAEIIIEKDLARVVYLKEYHDKKPLEEMKKHGIQVRQAGLR